MKAFLIATAALLASSMGGAFAQSYPSRPITLIVPFPAAARCALSKRSSATEIRPPDHGPARYTRTRTSTWDATINDLVNGDSRIRLKQNAKLLEMTDGYLRLGSTAAFTTTKIYTTSGKRGIPDYVNLAC